MAKPTKQEPEPEVTAHAVVKGKGGLWVARTYVIRGEEVLAYADSESDSRNACIGRALAALRRVG